MTAPFAKTGIGGSAVQLVGTATPVTRGTLVTAHPSNTGAVYVGSDSNLTTANGTPLAAGQSLYVPVVIASDASSIYLIGSASGQEVRAWVDMDRVPSNGNAVTGTASITGTVGIDQTTPGTTDSVTVKSNAFVSAPTVTRPANQTPYTTGDVVGGAITFTSAGPNGGHVVITSADLEIDIAAIPSGMTTFRLYLYDATPPSAIADNGAWDLPSGDRANFLGYVDLGTPVDLGSTCYVHTDNINRKFKLNASTSLWGYLVTNAGFTPAANSEVYKPRLHGLGV